MCSVITIKEVDEKIKKVGFFELNEDEVRRYYLVLIDDAVYTTNIRQCSFVKFLYDNRDALMRITRWFVYKGYYSPRLIKTIILDQWADEYITDEILHEDAYER